MSEHERSGWRDRALSLRHRAWGRNCPATDLDFLEYDMRKAVAIIEYKSELAGSVHPANANRMAMMDLADRANVPYFECRYSIDRSAWSITPLNERALERLPSSVNKISEAKYVKFLYWLRGREIPDEIREAIQEPWPAMPLSMEDAHAEIMMLREELSALKTYIAEIGRRPANAPVCEECGLLLNGPGFSVAGTYWHERCRNAQSFPKHPKT